MPHNIDWNKQFKDRNLKIVVYIVLIVLIVVIFIGIRESKIKSIGPIKFDTESDSSQSKKVKGNNTVTGRDSSENYQINVEKNNGVVKGKEINTK
jgi:hypothetical protein